MEPEGIIKIVCFMAFIFFSVAEPILRKLIGWIQERQGAEAPLGLSPEVPPAGERSSRTPFEELQQWVASLEDADADPLTGHPPSAKAIRKPRRQARRASPATRARPAPPPQSHGGHLDDHHLTPSIQVGRDSLPSEHGGDLDSHQLRVSLPAAGDVSPSVHGGRVDDRRLLSSFDNGRVPELARVKRAGRSGESALVRRLAGLSVLQQAVVMSEVLSPAPGAAAYKKRQRQPPRQLPVVDSGGGPDLAASPPVTGEGLSAGAAEPQQRAAEPEASPGDESDMENETRE